MPINQIIIINLVTREIRLGTLIFYQKHNLLINLKYLHLF